jgi:hypothetical protein
MKGFILNIRKAKNEDVIVTVLSKSHAKNYYRFYGARHSILKIGNFINFEVQDDNKKYMPRLKKVSQYNFPWSFDNKRVDIWQDFIKLFNPHLIDRAFIDGFYLNLLLNKAKKWHKQNPKRLAIEAYIEILKFENRVRISNYCYICQGGFDNRVGLMRGYIPVHPICINSYSYNKNSIFELFNSKSSINIDDNDINNLFNTLLRGL